MGKRYHITGDVWLVREGKYVPDYAVMVGDLKVASVYFFRQKTGRSVFVDCRMTYVETGVTVENFASYFGDALKFLRGWNWLRPAPTSVEEFRAMNGRLIFNGFKPNLPCFVLDATMIGKFFKDGRSDELVEVYAPDAETAKRAVTQYGHMVRSAQELAA